MLKTVLKCAGAVALVISAGAPIAASAQYNNSGYQLLYERWYYDDAEMTILVGHEQDRCTPYGNGGSPTEGRYGPYVHQEVWAVCNNGQLEVYGG